MNYLPEIEIDSLKYIGLHKNPEKEAERIRRYLIETKEHSLNFESVIFKKGWEDITKIDYQRPHDMFGENNKCQLDILLAMQLQYLNDPELNKLYVNPSLDRHRKQLHHLYYGDKDTEIKENTDIGYIIIGATDSYCALREPRFCFGGSHKPEEIKRLFSDNPPVKMVMAIYIQAEIEEIAFPDVHLSSVLDMPKELKISSTMADKTQDIIENRIYLLSELGYDKNELLRKVA
jgi:hypothetical protein